MTAEELEQQYYIATGEELPAGMADEILKQPENPWLKKILQRGAHPDIWQNLTGVYNEEKRK